MCCEGAVYGVSVGKPCLAMGYHTLHPVSSTVSLCVMGQREPELGELNVKWPSQAHRFEYLVPSWWCSVGKLCNLQEVESHWVKQVLGGRPWSFRALLLPVYSLLPEWIQSLAGSCDHAFPAVVDWLPLELKPKLFSLQVLLSVCLVTAQERKLRHLLSMAVAVCSSFPLSHYLWPSTSGKEEQGKLSIFADPCHPDTWKVLTSFCDHRPYMGEYSEGSKSSKSSWSDCLEMHS